MRGLDAAVAGFRSRRAPPLAPLPAPAHSVLSDYSDTAALGRLERDGELASFAAAALDASGDGYDPVAAAAACALARGGFVEALPAVARDRALAVAALALAARSAPCHIVTPDPSAAEAWAVTAAPLFAAFGLTLTAIREQATPAERRKAYTADAVAVASRTLIADVTRDELILGPLAHPSRRAAADLHKASARHTATITRGLGNALFLDVAASLFDDAVAPVRLTRAAPDTGLAEQCRAALQFARGLEPGTHFRERPPTGFEWTAAGERALAGAPGHRDFVANAVRALYLLEEGRDYTARDGAVTLRDSATEEELSGRSYRQGLQQTVEILAGVTPSALVESVAQISVPGFFRSASLLAGTAPSLAGLRGELFAVYRGRSSAASPPATLPHLEFHADEPSLTEALIREASHSGATVVAPNRTTSAAISRALRAATPVVTTATDALPEPTPNRLLFGKLPSSARSACQLAASANSIQFYSSPDDPLLAGASSLAKRLLRFPPLRPVAVHLLWRQLAKQARKARLATLRADDWGRSVLSR